MKINVRDLKPGDQTVLDGATEVVRSTRYGDGLASFNGQTSKPVVVSFESGKEIILHPGHLVSISQRP